LTLLLALILASSDVQPASPDALVGGWINQAATTGITQVVVRREGADLSVHAWGKCTPIDCDWGQTKITLWNSLPTATWDHDFKVTKMELILLPDQRLLAAYHTEYHDNSGRRGRDGAEYFLREKPENADAATAEAKALLSKVAESYRNLKTGHFEFEQITERTGEHSASRRTLRCKILISQPGKLRVETTGSGEEPTTLISDGQTTWQYYPKANEFTKVPAGMQPLGSPLLGSYVWLGEIREPAKIIGQERLGTTVCTIIRVGREGGFARTLWIDPKTETVWKEEWTESSTTGGAPSNKTEIRFTVAETQSVLASELFVFDPSRTQARDRRERQQKAPLTSPGTAAPDFTLRDLDGKEVKLIDLRGKAVLLDFWATWCAPCRAVMPVVELLHREFNDKGLVVFGVDDENPEVIVKFLQKSGYTLPTLHDPDRQVYNKYEVGGIPTMILIDKQGKIALFKVESGTYEELRDVLRAQGIW
jgi:peroxiredoxin/outer membrane lipoprotein-sorting protein